MGNEDSEAHAADPKNFDAAEVIMEHIMDNHEFHFADVNGHAISIPLPVILYSPQRGLDVFMSSKFEHGHANYKGYKMEHDHIIPITESGAVDETVKVYDLSLTRNVVQMFIALFLLVILMVNVAKKYRRNGANVAPSGFQNAVEPVITFVRDEVGKPNLGHKYEKYMPYLLTIFFFILINNLFGLIPGFANVTGNISFTLVLAVISLIVILFSTNSHFWGHIFWPPGVPFLVKLILIPVEFLGIFIKPAALMIRLFANMVAGHIVIICFISLIFIFGAMNTVAGIGFSPVSMAFTVFIYVIEILVAFIQAFIFTNLTAVFIGQAFETGHGHEEGHGNAVAHGDPHPTAEGKEKEFAL
ncbi:F0F1 ATP synthase subunit A [Aridibaculum aurantiacum]|uniref:F0F1 ATP synthase subunit A n=1 Tax=Aridibaculum aurantiacum TaxID=2810307 RepID=UPI001F615B4F|nr:F0F1 ATP synthase subunit A [Aridibaculum aurantiacum]